MLKEKIQAYDSYDNGGSDLSVTDVNKGTKAVVLGKRISVPFKDLTTKEKENLTYNIIGNAIDEYVEKVIENDDDFIGHTRLYFRVIYKGVSRLISGEFDAFHIPTGTVIDVKTFSVNKARRVAGGDDEDYRRQLNGYAWLIKEGYIDRECTRKFPYEAKELMICNITRDYNMFTNDPGITEMYFDKEPINVTRNRYMMKIKAVIDYEKTEARLIPPCSPEQRWQSETTHPVFKLGSKGEKKKSPTAMPKTAGFKTHQEALDFISNHKDKKKLYTEVRKAEASKCVHSCTLSGRGCDYLEQLNKNDI